MDVQHLYCATVLTKGLATNGDKMRVIIRVDGKDYDIDNIQPGSDGVLGDYLVLVAKPLDM